MSFESFYYGAVHHPWQLWIAVGLATLYTCTRPGLDPGLRRYGAGLGLLSAVDAWLTASAPYGVGPLSGAAASAFPLFFVLAGDFRYLWLAVAAGPDGRLWPSPPAAAQALALTLVVPLLSQLILAALPEAGPRTLYLVYELAFFALAAALLWRHPNTAAAPWLRGLHRFVMFYYGLWAGADVWILATGSDLGFALRLVPNLLYYGGLIAAIGWFAPRPGTKPS